MGGGAELLLQENTLIWNPEKFLFSDSPSPPPPLLTRRPLHNPDYISCWFYSVDTLNNKAEKLEGIKL